MTIALWCVLIAGVLPYVATLIAKRGPGAGRYDNRHPRDWLARKEGHLARANAAQMNGFEAFPFFAAAVIIAHLLRGSQPLVDVLAMVFVGARMVYLILYLADQSTLRSLVWCVGFLSVIGIFVCAAI